MWILLLIFILVLYVYFTRNSEYWSDRNVIFEPPLPLIGNFLNTILRKEGFGDVIKRVYDKFGDVPYFGMFFFCTPFLVIKNRELIKHVLIKDFGSFPNRPTYSKEFIDKWSTNTLLTLKNDEWKSLRKKLSRIFTSGKTKLMMPLMKQVTRQLEYYLSKKNGEIDVRELSKKYFIEIISVCVFGITPNNLNDEPSHLRDMAGRLLNVETYKWIFSLVFYFICPIFIKLGNLQFINKRAAEYFVNIFEQSYKKRRENNVGNDDIIDILLKLKRHETEDDVFKLNDIRLSAQALLFFQTGREPASAILSFCLYELALNKSIQDRLRAEILENLDVDDDHTYEILINMPFLDNVLKETLRKYPVAQSLFRRSEKDYIFEEGGLRIEKGTNLIIPMTAVHYDPQYYPNPDKFDPERFSGVKYKDLQYVFFPFGEGPRKCIGYRFAEMSMKLALAMLLKDFEFTTSERTEIPMKLSKNSFLLTPASNKIFLNVQRIIRTK